MILLNQNQIILMKLKNQEQFQKKKVLPKKPTMTETKQFISLNLNIGLRRVVSYKLMMALINDFISLFN